MSDVLGGGFILAIDTSTRTSIVTAGRDAPVATARRDAGHRHGSHVLEQIDAVLDEAGLDLDEVAALAVGTGPGSFTGLRVGLATAKTIAYTRNLPLVGIMSSDALRLAAGLETAAVVLRAGARDHYLVLPGEDPVLISPGGLRPAIGDAPSLAVDMALDDLGEAAARLGRSAVEGLPAALLALARQRLEAGDVDDAARLTPAYVALPRGVKRAAEDLGWSPDLR